MQYEKRNIYEKMKMKCKLWIMDCAFWWITKKYVPRRNEKKKKKKENTNKEKCRISRGNQEEITSCRVVTTIQNNGRGNLR